MFYCCYNIITIPSLKTSKGETFSHIFSGCYNLETIEGVDFSNAQDVSYAFNNCSALKNLTFNGVIKVTWLDLSPCTSLTHDSLMSTINTLYDWASEGSTNTYTLELGSTNLAKLTDAEIAIATQKGWELR